ncbi:hypothetical protein [Microbispora sp. GKU 823]|uniref:hypothetical protein n=1 Tax=Microbispora sp. GKU 823 TaxID=1652100 RepID=UPI0009A39287|nr:hypothetical protein [Microbispora sp. GKU 823]OPG13644.1 hypothetical protein B1L11_06565 [Microbispora sp. GKU 823]
MSTTDPVLRALVFAVDTAKGQMGVTLAVNGAIITGLLVSPEEYADAVMTQIRRSRVEEIPEGEGLEVFFTGIAKRAEERRERYRAAALAGGLDSDSEPDLPEYLHLIDAFPVTGDRLPGGTGAIWRIRLADISGWTIAQIGASGR